MTYAFYHSSIGLLETLEACDAGLNETLRENLPNAFDLATYERRIEPHSLIHRLRQ